MAIYLLYGEETYLLETKVKKIKKDFGETTTGINFIKIDDTNVEELISDIETPAFGYERKLILAKNTGLFKKEKKAKVKAKEDKNSRKEKKKEEFSLVDKIAEYLKENKEILKDSVELVFIEQEVEKNLLYEVIGEIGEIKNFEILKMPQIITNLKKIAGAYQVIIEDNCAKYLIECCRDKYARITK